MYIDTHSHIILGKLKGKEEKIIKNAFSVNVKKIITIGCDLKEIEESKICAERFDNVFFAAGIHPCNNINTSINWDTFKNYLSHNKCVAVGECGFDFYYDGYDEELQKDIFIRQIKISKEYNLPLIIHTRNAANKMLEILKKHLPKKFVVHCFTETKSFANEILDFGGFISFTGIITYPKAEEVREIVKFIPLEKIMLETDCPFLAPQSVRGTVNEPKNIPEIAKKVAEIKGISINKVAEITTRTAEQFFEI